MTMRYADISEPSRLSIPNIPSLPNDLRSGTSGRDQEAKVPLAESLEALEDPMKADIQAMERENFDPDTCEFL